MARASDSHDSHVKLKALKSAYNPAAHTSVDVGLQWLRGRASYSRLREPGFESCAAVVNIEHVFSFYIAPVHSAV